MKKLFLVKPDLFLPNEITIVGSSKILLKKMNGNLIDSSNFVARFNFAKIEGFQKYTGSIISLMIINNHNYKSMLNNEIQSNKFTKYLIISPYFEKEKKIKKNYFFFEKKSSQFFLALSFLNSFGIFIQLIKILRKKSFSVGFCFILMCIKSKIKIKIFGFDLNENMRQREHYYQKRGIGNRHDLEIEHVILKKLKEKNEFIDFH